MNMAAVFTQIQFTGSDPFIQFHRFFDWHKQVSGTRGNERGGSDAAQLQRSIMGQAGIALGPIGISGHGIRIQSVLTLRLPKHVLTGVLNALRKGHPLIQMFKRGFVELLHTVPQSFDGPAKAVADTGEGAGQNERADSVGMPGRQVLGDRSAHGNTVHMGLRYL